MCKCIIYVTGAVNPPQVNTALNTQVHTLWRIKEIKKCIKLLNVASQYSLCTDLVYIIDIIAATNPSQVYTGLNTQLHTMMYVREL